MCVFDLDNMSMQSIDIVNDPMIVKHQVHSELLWKIKVKWAVYKHTGTLLSVPQLTQTESHRSANKISESDLA